MIGTSQGLDCFRSAWLDRLRTPTIRSLTAAMLIVLPICTVARTDECRAAEHVTSSGTRYTGVWHIEISMRLGMGEVGRESAASIDGYVILRSGSNKLHLSQKELDLYLDIDLQELDMKLSGVVDVPELLENTGGVGGYYRIQSQQKIGNGSISEKLYGIPSAGLQCSGCKYEELSVDIAFDFIGSENINQIIINAGNPFAGSTAEIIGLVEQIRRGDIETWPDGEPARWIDRPPNHPAQREVERRFGHAVGSATTRTIADPSELIATVAERPGVISVLNFNEAPTLPATVKVLTTLAPYQGEIETSYSTIPPIGSRETRENAEADDDELALAAGTIIPEENYGDLSDKLSRYNFQHRAYFEPPDPGYSKKVIEEVRIVEWRRTYSEVKVSLVMWNPSNLRHARRRADLFVRREGSAWTILGHRYGTRIVWADGHPPPEPVPAVNLAPSATFGAPPPQRSDVFRIIVNANNPFVGSPEETIRLVDGIYRREISAWPDGTPAQWIDRPTEHAARRAFEARYGSVKSSVDGHAIAAARDVVTTVARQPGAISILGAGEVPTLPAKVRVLTTLEPNQEILRNRTSTNPTAAIVTGHYDSRRKTKAPYEISKLAKGAIIHSDGYGDLLNKLRNYNVKNRIYDRPDSASWNKAINIVKIDEFKVIDQNGTYLEAEISVTTVNSFNGIFANETATVFVTSVGGGHWTVLGHRDGRRAIWGGGSP